MPYLPPLSLPKSPFVLLEVQGQGKLMLTRLLPGLAQISKLWRGLEDEEIKPVAVLYCCSLRKQGLSHRGIILLAFSHKSSKQHLWQYPECCDRQFHQCPLCMEDSIQKPVYPSGINHVTVPVVIPTFLNCNSYFPGLIAQRMKQDRLVHPMVFPACPHIQRHEYHLLPHFYTRF